MTRSSIALCVCFTAILVSQAAISHAAPTAYKVEMTGAFDGIGSSHPVLNGARLSITYVLDTQGLSPSTSLGDPDVTWWDMYTNVTQVSVVLSGTPANDGAIPAAKYQVPIISALPPTPWILRSSPSGGSITFPTISFALNGSTVAINAHANLDGVFLDTGAVSFPKPFSASQASEWIATVYTSNPSTQDRAVDVSGYGYVVPEPATLSLAGLAMLGLAAFRRRK